MTLAVGTNIQLGYVKEVAWGTTPATPQLQLLRVTAITPSYNRTTTQSTELTTAREIADFIRTDEKGGLSFNHELSYGNLDDVLESIAGGAWGTNVLKVGGTRRSDAVELGFTDIGQYCLFNGAIYNAFSLQVQRGQIINGSAGFLSKTGTWDTATISTAAATATPTNSVMDPIASVQLIQEGGSGAVANPQEFSMALTNGVIEFPQLSSIDPADLELGQLKAAGTLSQFFADRTLVDKAVSFADTSLAVTLGGASAKKYALVFSKVKLSIDSIAGLSVNNAVVVKFKWEAKYDATNSTMKITRTA